jgi:LmbE family N-acetylglucosaminyl deacetylase
MRSGSCAFPAERVSAMSRHLFACVTRIVNARNSTACAADTGASNRVTMVHMRRPVVAVACALAVSLSARAAGPAETRGEIGLALMLRKLATVGTVMHATAHPDDENNALLAKQSLGQGFRVVLATATRGNGGQNEIGPELFEALGVLRTEELLAAHRIDGAEQFFTRAVDFGYSFSIEETYEKWGHDEIVGDYVRLIRMTRPDLIVAMRPDGAGGGQHHQASARLAAEAFDAAGDPARYPEQLREGLHAWHPRKIYQARWYGMFERGTPPPSENLVTVDADVYDPLLGQTWAEIGSEARAMHKCQGFGQLLALPGPFVVKYKLVGTTIDSQRNAQERTLEDGLDLTLPGLARFAGATTPARLVEGLNAIATAVGGADATYRAHGANATLADLARGLRATRDLRTWLESAALDKTAAFEIDFRLARTEREFEQALVVAQGLRMEALADDGIVVPGQPIKLTAIVANRGAAPVDVEDVTVNGFDGSLPPCTTGAVRPGEAIRCEGALGVPHDARVSEPYWHREGEAGRYTFDSDAPFGLPFRPTPFQAEMSLGIAGVPVKVSLPVQYRYEGNIFSGEKRMELQVVPALSVRSAPDIVIVPTTSGLQRTSNATRAAQTREIRVTVTNNSPGASEADVQLPAPEGWSVSPSAGHVRFERADETDTVRFTLAPSGPITTEQFLVGAVARTGSTEYNRGFQVIEYPHIRRRHVYDAAATTVKVIDVRLPQGLSIGYVMGVGDQVPAALEQIGATVRMLNADELAYGDLSRFDAIVTGVRAYERRPDLRASNHRLIEYAEGGGTVLVQYNKMEFNQAQYGPYPAKISANRVTDEHAPVTVLHPEHPVFVSPNPITEAAWSGWVQERGLYFLGERDPRYVDLVELSDPFELNKGPKRGALVDAPVGKGHWVYVGLNLWRQLPAGTPGAYALLANLVSLGRSGQAAAGLAR